MGQRASLVEENCLSGQAYVPNSLSNLPLPDSVQKAELNERRRQQGGTQTITGLRTSGSMTQVPQTGEPSAIVPGAIRMINIHRRRARVAERDTVATTIPTAGAEGRKVAPRVSMVARRAVRRVASHGQTYPSQRLGPQRATISLPQGTTFTPSNHSPASGNYVCH
jgi:hypothetical protein